MDPENRIGFQSPRPIISLPGHGITKIMTMSAKRKSQNALLYFRGSAICFLATALPRVISMVAITIPVGCSTQ